MADSKAATAAAPSKDAPGAPKGKDAAAAAPAKAAVAAPGKKKNSKPILLIAGGLLLLLVATGAAAYFLFLGKPDGPEPATAQAGKDKGAKGKEAGKGKEKDKKEEAKKPYFVEFETFTVNLKDPEKFLQIKLTFQVKDVEAAETVKERMPIVRSAVIPVLSAQDPADLMAKEGKEKLSNEVVVAANKAVAGTPADESIDAVLITHMLIQ
jgi:flagellar FliL protein